MTEQQVLDFARKEGFAYAAIVDTAEIPFDPAFRPYCEENLCGQYGVNHSCPPDCGTPEEMRLRVVKKRRALVLETVWDIADWSDKAATSQAKREHNQRSISLIQKLRQEAFDGFMVGASGCALCKPCTAAEGKPCRYPQMQYSCMSAYCIYVKGLCERCGLPYDCGPGKLGLFGMFVFD